ncbi:MAG TPA: DegT/DnrJ/EryC1/StrS family aminotransferase [Candidatus Saccharimonadia bacterium]|nr:DegT/DnrJ/EryC1/StrS family aminotransferase [Candidatus Saccharimonadia bacterium]
MITIAAPEIGPEEIGAVNEVLKSGMLAQGPKVAEFESAFAAFCGTKYALAVNSGTAAIHAALFAAGVGPGDEVITTPFSFIATINPILMVGAKPVLVDIDPLTFNIDPAQIEAKITSATKAIIPVYLYGQVCDYDAIDRIAKKHSLVVIEDACQAVGATYEGKKAGALGTMGCFSLYATKNIMCGEGGVITTDDEALAVAIKQFRQHGMSGTYQYEHIGYNYRLSDLHAAIAVEQLKKCDSFNKHRQENAAQFDVGLADVPGLVLPTTIPGRTHVYHQYTLRIQATFGVNRQEFVDALRERGVGVGVYYPQPLHMIPHIARFGYKKGDFPEAEKAAQEVVSLPVHPKVSADDIKTILTTIKEIAHA